MTTAGDTTKKSWREEFPVHPAADFPAMSKAGLAELAADIKTNGLINPIVLWQASKDAPAQVLDGCSRLDACEIALGRPVRITSRTYRGRISWSLEADDEDGQPTPIDDLIGDHTGFPLGTRVESIFVVLGPDTDPYDFVIAANIHRRHLTPERKREMIGKL